MSRLLTIFHVRGPALDGRRTAGAIVFLVGVVLVSSAIAWDGNVPTWERKILEFFNGWPEALRPFMWFTQQPGALMVPVAIGVVVAGLARRWYYLIPFVLLPVYKLTIEKGIVKQLVDRARPYTSVGPEIDVRGPSELAEKSFPSGHSTTAAAAGLLVAAFLPPKWRPFAIAWGFWVGIARMWYGEHNFLDVVAGWALGTIFVLVIYYVLISRWIGDGPNSQAKEA